jgi:hypothetical protein
MRNMAAKNEEFNWDPKDKPPEEDLILKQKQEALKAKVGEIPKAGQSTEPAKGGAGSYFGTAGVIIWKLLAGRVGAEPLADKEKDDIMEAGSELDKKYNLGGKAGPEIAYASAILTPLFTKNRLEAFIESRRRTLEARQPKQQPQPSGQVQAPEIVNPQPSSPSQSPLNFAGNQPDPNSTQ